MGYSQHEFSVINMLYSLKKIIVSITPLLLPHNSYLSTTATFDYIELQQNRTEKNRINYVMSKTWEVFAQSSEPEAHVKNAQQTKNTKQDHKM